MTKQFKTVPPNVHLWFKGPMNCVYSDNYPGPKKASELIKQELKFIQGKKVNNNYSHYFKAFQFYAPNKRYLDSPPMKIDVTFKSNKYLGVFGPINKNSRNIIQESKLPIKNKKMMLSDLLEYLEIYAFVHDHPIIVIVQACRRLKNSVTGNCITNKSGCVTSKNTKNHQLVCLNQTDPNTGNYIVNPLNSKYNQVFSYLRNFQAYERRISADYVKKYRLYKNRSLRSPRSRSRSY